ncbi:MAG: NfeD family protein [Mycobacteriales bacterium]
MTPLTAARRCALVLLALGASVTLAVPAEAATAEPNTVNIVQVVGVIDPAYADYIADEIRYSNERGHLAVLLRLDSPGSMKIDDAKLLELVGSSAVPVATWIGPNDAKASGLAAVMHNVAPIRMRSNDASLGAVLPLQPGGARRQGGRPTTVEELGVLMATGNVQPVAEVPAATLPEAVRALDGKVVDGTTLRVDATQVTVRFATPGLLRRVRHSLIAPTLVYLLLLAGVFMLVFESFQPGFGPAGYAGILTVALAAYGLAGLPANPPFLAILVIGLLAMTYDVARNALSLPTWLGVAAFTVGSVFLFHSRGPAMRLPILAVLIGVLSSLVFFAVVMTVVLRALRGQSAEMGQALLGRIGEVRSTLNPQGHVLIEGALWRARAIEWDGPVDTGTRVQVTGVDPEALILDVEPVPAD